MREPFGYEHLPRHRGKVRTAIFVGLTACATLAAAYLTPKALSEEETGTGSATLQYGETVEHAIGSVCTKFGDFDIDASLGASKAVGQDGHGQAMRFTHPQSGTVLSITCVSYGLPALNNRLP